MIVRFYKSNHESYEDYQEWTVGYLDVPSKEWLEEKGNLYIESIKDILKKYGLYSETIANILQKARKRYIIGIIQDYLNNYTDFPKDSVKGPIKDSKEKVIKIIRILYCYKEISDLSFYSFLTKFEEVKEIEVSEFYDDDFDKFGCYELVEKLTSELDYLGGDPDQIYSIEGSIDDIINEVCMDDVFEYFGIK